MTLVEFLTARLDEDEAAARAATAGPWGFEHEDDGDTIYSGDLWVGETSYDMQSGSLRNSVADGEHIARHDPARVLAEVEAKRRIVAAIEPGGDGYWTGECDVQDEVLRALASVYADHADYDEVWKP